MSARSNATRPATPPMQQIPFKIGDTVKVTDKVTVRREKATGKPSLRDIPAGTFVRIYRIHDNRSTPLQTTSRAPSAADVLYYFKVDLQIPVEILGEKTKAPVTTTSLSFPSSHTAQSLKLHGVRATMLEATVSGSMTFQKGERVIIVSNAVSKTGNTLIKSHSPWVYLQKFTLGMESQEFSGSHGLGHSSFERVA